MHPGSLHHSPRATSTAADISFVSALVAAPHEGRRNHAFASIPERLAAPPRDRRRSHDLISTRERLVAAPPREKGR